MSEGTGRFRILEERQMKAGFELVHSYSDEQIMIGVQMRLYEERSELANLLRR